MSQAPFLRSNPVIDSPCSYIVSSTIDYVLFEYYLRLSASISSIPLRSGCSFTRTLLPPLCLCCLSLTKRLCRENLPHMSAPREQYLCKSLSERCRTLTTSTRRRTAKDFRLDRVTVQPSRRHMQDGVAGRYLESSHGFWWYSC